MIRRRDFLIGCTSVAVASGIERQAFAQAAPFRVGVLTPITGSGSAYGSGMQLTIQGVAEAINAAGGATGRRIEIFVEDSQTKPEAAVLAAQKLVNVSKVEAILGTWSSGEAMAVLTSVTNPNDVIHMTVAGTPDFTSQAKPNLGWQVTPSSYAYGVIYAKIARELGYKRPATLQFNNASGLAQIQGFNDAWQKMGGTVVSSVIYEGNRPSYRSELQSVLSGQPDVLICASYATDALSILREAFQAGTSANFIVSAWALTDKLSEMLGNEFVARISSCNARLAQDTPSVKAYDELYRRVKGADGSSNSYGAMCFDMMNMLGLAVEVAGPSADRARIATAIRAVANGPGTKVYGFAEGKKALASGAIKYSGASAELHFDDHGAETSSAFDWLRYENGKQKAVAILTIS
ncbi:MAG TPA: ABC transporter substrate-binding protein [Xanthobacteraceae bacterium]|nr:ABC transporter substrate-binding protein [Xanthobacteraceae bacterium]